MTSQLFVALQLFEQLGDGLENIVGNIAAARAWVGDELGLVELLGDGECPLRREPIAAVGFLLQGGKVVDVTQIVILEIVSSSVVPTVRDCKL